ncbi:MAG TPA: LytR C-terminal domain-containing protein, partial [Actinomycetota bacterium]|nr:LytR C-terminal domain-containing protein [Actinomycetota bacterium]
GAAGWLAAGPHRATAPAGRPRLVLLAVVGGERPLLAVVGAGGTARAAAVTLPPEAVAVVPGYGEATFAEASRLPGPMLRAAAANVLGLWVDRYAVVAADALAAAVDRAGGLPLRLPAELSGSGEPSRVTFSGEQLVGFLAGRGEAADLRWRVALGALLGRGVLGTADLSETDDGAAAVRILRAAGGAEVAPLPTRRLDEGLLLPDLDAVDGLAARLFGGPGTAPVRVSVWNGSGTPGVGRLVAERLIPAGFRIVLSENADAFGQAETVITAVGREHRAAAERVRELLGVGRVQVQRVPSGFSDLGIVVGEDFG